MTEFIWDGKYEDDKKQGPARIVLPLQMIETVNGSTGPTIKSNHVGD